MDGHRLYLRVDNDRIGPGTYSNVRMVIVARRNHSWLGSRLVPLDCDSQYERLCVHTSGKPTGQSRACREVALALFASCASCLF